MRRTFGTKWSSFFATLTFIALYSSVNAAFAEDCTDRLIKRRDADIALGFRDFDQSEEQGWRDLSNNDCFKEAAELIKAYIAAKPDSPSVVRWHLAQMHGHAENYTEARSVALTVLRPEPGQFPPGFHRNDYVLATISFWDQDKTSLKHHLSLIEGEASAARLPNR